MRIPIDNFKIILAEERERKNKQKIKLMEFEKVENIKKLKLEKELARKEKEKELKERITFERDRKKELAKIYSIRASGSSKRTS